MIVCGIFDHEARKRSYQIVAELFPEGMNA